MVKQIYQSIYVELPIYIINLKYALLHLCFELD